jgi:hypothetical protein
MDEYPPALDEAEFPPAVDEEWCPLAVDEVEYPPAVDEECPPVDEAQYPSAVDEECPPVVYKTRSAMTIPELQAEIRRLSIKNARSSRRG